ncbi:hypothetical protein FUT84_08490 [Treponema phagedenis]|uniref:hypothetical protein n=1 Tax=Treponema phagedenis TaxID=162 RepID=UPI0011E655FB|nr:hypothetical protein [Treponema phagedenis]QEK01183.1 hypothetical protein FUT84_08490 [Treponema phagedenis]
MEERKPEYGYSVGITGFALLNRDGSYPTPNDWEHKDKSGNKIKHKGGIVGGAEKINIAGWSDEDLKVGVVYGVRRGEFTLTCTAANKEAVTIDEMVADLNTAFKTLEAEGIKLKAAKTPKGSDYDDGYLRITDAAIGEDALPFYAPIGFSGRLAKTLGINGWVFTREAKSVKTDFEKESGKRVDATSGHGIRCSVKETDKIKGSNLTISAAAIDNQTLAMITGNTYNEETDEFFYDNTGDPPNFACMYFVMQFLSGVNTKTNFAKMKVFCLPSCQVAPSGEEAGEDNFGTKEITGSGGENKRSALPLLFHKGISANDYRKFVDAE